MTQLTNGQAGLVNRRPVALATLFSAALLALAVSLASAAELRLGPSSLSVMGQDTVTLRSQRVSGSQTSRSAFRWNDSSLSSSFEHRTDLVVHGELLPNLRIDAAVARGPYALGRQRMTFTFDGGDAVVKAGDLVVAFDGTELGAFQRSLRGIQVDSALAGGALALVASESKPAVRTDVLYGRNSSGPYYLAASPLIDASEVVEVDGRRMQRGADYSMDYQVGIILFAPALIISPTSRIVVRYECDAPGAPSGSLIGLRATYPVSAGLRFGATYLGLQRRGGGSAASAAAKEDRWLGNSSAGPFTLTFRPIEPGSERVRLDGILQVQGRDYRIDYATGSIFFLNPVPAGVSIIVTYRVPGAQQSATPERSLVAVDAHFAAGRHLNFDAEVARSAGGPGLVGVAGSALVLSARGNWDRFSLATNLRSADAGFTPFESAGSRGVRSGFDWLMGFQPAQGLRISAGMRDYRRPYFEYGDASGLSVRDRSRELSLEFSRPGWPTLTYAGSWSALSAAGASPLTERSGNQVVSLGYQAQAYGAKATYRRNSHAREGEAPLTPYLSAGDGLSSSGSLAFAGAYSGRDDGTALSMWYRPAANLSVVCDFARSAMALAGGGETNAGSSRLAVEFAPTPKVSLSLGYRANSSGDTVSADGRTVSGSNSRSHVVALRHNPMPNLSLNLAYDRQMSQGGYGTNSDTDSWSGGFCWQPAESLSLVGQYTRQRLNYLGASGRSANNIASLGATIGPFGPGFKLDLSYSHMQGQTSGSFGSYGDAAAPYSEAGAAAYGYGEYGSLAVHGMANSSFRARIAYPVADRQEAFAEWESSSNSGYPGGNRRTALAAGWRIGLTRELNFVVDWRRIASQSSDARYSYRAQTLSGQLGLKF